MAYLTPAQLVARFGPEPIAQLSDRGSQQLVSADLLELVIAGGSTAGYTQQEIDAAQEAVALLTQTIAEQQSVADGYLGGRYPVPLSTVPPALSAALSAMVYFALHVDQSSETVMIRRDQALSWLRDIAAGRASIDPSSVTVASGSSSVRFSQGDQRIFSRTAVGDG